jgi:hypothetical protein
MNRNFNAQKKDTIDIGSNPHLKLIDLFSKSSIVLSKIVKHCKIDVINDILVILTFDKETIYSVQAKKRKYELIEKFSEIVKNKMQVEIRISNS